MRPKVTLKEQMGCRGWGRTSTNNLTTVIPAGPREGLTCLTVNSGPAVLLAEGFGGDGSSSPPLGVRLSFDGSMDDTLVDVEVGLGK